MNRAHLVEIHELPVCPQVIRDGLTDFLQAGMRGTDMFGPMVPMLVQAMERTGDDRIVDMCSGGGGPWLRLRHQIGAEAGRPIDVTLTDLHPSDSARGRVPEGAEGIRYLPDTVDARAVPAHLQGFRTMFNCFHQFQPDDARAILADAMRRRQGIAIFEATRRDPLTIFLSASLPPIVSVVSLFIRPFSLARLFFSWILPIIPFVVTFDAVVSCLRTYDLDEIDAMLDTLQSPDWRWERGVSRAGVLPIGITWIVGTPVEPPSDSLVE